MYEYLVDRMTIADLINGWIYRDLAQWDSLRELFHPEGTIEVTWFEGLFSEFVDASMHMGSSDLRTKHFIAAPMVTFNACRAIVETNAIIVGENVTLGLGCSVHNRFYDWVEQRNGVWKIIKRQSIYDMGSFTFPQGLVDIDAESLQRYPREYAPLAYVLEKSGFPVTRVFATKGSQMETDMKTAGLAWLAR
ncbi:nuclear transport factor 2 family protein [Pseudomonas sp. CCI3.2]|uniref:nuclear transport factor 2 family protein n=2 Tax=Pseudomonas TaxID=286 RepID=UPI002AC9BE15|nr:MULTISPECIES: nuclear transport factor 2 family protein [unclassified Pseudomonas]MEB0079976.1 nuclear transport factor 2 family protein [Pseudomonas sp. MH10out]MEB0093993.1 nuclear transport factor 2 family protein [Pseudomonas sp. CCI4.2]MEB0102430.1 nuclear transport factor 2 family protein [Pseudomonas sp. CCI3.2]MEB0133093.1 nuclear transport factor 2 family protein [Pseudomonas sp. CCI2.4]MEB0160274.1 nuclear transport factor 2 family protein [Pseudomonas sp. AH2 (2023)]